ncbi:HAD family hydrolase [uncultured Roseobacter sp.]|uniref:HAD family hydrolase n=1 Tax=uncultured Roseobacter sp. TaxID=114847 RepID=UPI00261B3D2A|nr:HAD family hydrolase [uncultured Roseobacter sp.]
MTAIRAVLFDKDGTLFDFGATWESWAQGFLMRLARDPQEAAELGARIGFDLAARRFAPDSIAIAGTPGEVADALLPHLDGWSRPGLIGLINTEAETAPQVEVVPLVPYLEALRARGLRLGVATNDAEAPARVHLASAGADGLFDFIAGFDSGHGAKPGPGQLLAFARAMGVPPEAVLMVGDSTHDLMAAQAAGMPSVGVLTGLAAQSDLAPLADVVLRDIGALPGWLAARAA